MQNIQEAEATEITPLLTRTSDEPSPSSPSFPQSREEAKRHVDEIRQTHHDQYSNDEMVQTVFKRLCEEQYSSLNRFLFELLQNADDNAYGDRTPQVALRYDGRYFSLESNELGFSKKNVTSICKFSQSTKANKATSPSDHNFIGEKGIGFKSVFMIATKIWIKSGHYSFFFDRNLPLGEISPHWAEHFPVAANVPNGTLIVLELSKDFQGAEKTAELVAILQNFSATELLFLSQVKRIDIELARATSWISRILSQNETWETTLTANKISDELKILNVVHTWKEDRMSAYVTYRHTVNCMPPDDRRSGRLSSEIILGFPERIDEKETIETKNVYAFLPVRDYGFKFLVQSDFIVSTNREGIQPCEWNKRLVEEIPKVFGEAILKSKTQCPELWFKWPLLLPDRTGEDGVFQRIGELLLEVLPRQRVLQDVDGHTRTPAELFSIPEHFRVEAGYPLIPSELSGHKIISEVYPIQTSKYLERLGVRALTNRQFLNDLKTYIKRFPSEFQRKTNSWHVQLCSALLKLVREYKEEILSLPIVPLYGQDRWVAAKSGNLYFAIDGLDSALPGNLQNYWAIDPSYYGTARGQLFVQLGATQGSTAQLCKFVIDENWSSMRSASTTRQDMIRQIRFLYEANWKPSITFSQGLWFMTRDMVKAQASELYIESDTALMASTIPIEAGQKLQFIHPDYIESLRDFPDGSEWLMKTFGLQSQLRLVDHRKAPHEDFQRLLNKAPRIALEVLKAHWSFYYPLFQNGNCPQRLINFISDSVFPCRGTSMHMLKETYLPTSSITLLCHQSTDQSSPVSRPSRSCCSLIQYKMPPEETSTYSSIVPADRLLDVPSPDDEDWGFLSIFGVTTQPNANLFIRLLREVRGQQVPHMYVKEIYMQLEKYRATSEKYLIDWLFHERQCIYIPHQYNGQTGDWCDIEACVWQGPACLRQTPQLISFYAEFRGLFKDLTPTTTFSTMKKEVNHLDTKDIAHIFAVLQSLSDLLVQSWGKSDTTTPDVSSWCMFPVKLAATGEVILCSWGVLSDAPWLIPDEPHLWQAFDGVVDLCRLSSKDLQSLSGLARYLKFDTRWISRYVTKRTLGPEDAICKPVEQYTQNLRDKARYMAQLIPPEIGEGRATEIKKLLQNIKVFQSDRIKTLWTLRLRDMVHETVSWENQAVVQIQDNVLQAYVVCEDEFLSQGYIPPDLVHALVEFCRIEDPEDVGLLATILERSNDAFNEKDLHHRAQRRMVPTYQSTWLSQSEDFNSVAANECAMPGSGENAGESSSHNDGRGPSKAQRSEGLTTVGPQEGEKGRLKKLDGEPDLKPKPGTASGSDKAAGKLGLFPGSINKKKPDVSKENGNKISLSLSSRWLKEEVKDKPDEPEGNPHRSKNAELEDEPIHRDVEEDKPNTEGGKPPSSSRRVEDSSIVKPGILSGNERERGRDHQRTETVADRSTRCSQQPLQRPMDHPSSETTKPHPTAKSDNLPLPGNDVRSLSVGDAARVHSSPWTVGLPTDYSKKLEARREEQDRTAAKSKPVSDRLNDYVSMSKGRFQPRTSATTFEGYDTQETVYRGELCMSKVLASFLKSGYEAKRHWTSPMRSKHGLSRFYPEEGTAHSTFTISEDEGKLRATVIKELPTREFQISKSCTFHIQVCATNLGLHSQFQLSSEQYEKARNLKLHPHQQSRNVYILARVYDLGSDPHYALYIDPWHLYEDNRILLHSLSPFVAKVIPKAKFLLAGSYRAASGVAGGNGNSIYRGLEIKDKQIRLLKLSLDENKPLKATLVRKDLQQVPVYWAISYVWGLTPTTMGPFLDVNGVQVPITDSLSYCLTCLRQQRVDAFIWVDAICINQNDDTEKAIQVRQMGKVYQMAEQVIIWMGLEQTNEKGVLEAVSKLRDARRDIKLEYQLLLDDVRLIDSFLHRQWFSRTWIIQELVFASKPFLMHGSSRIEWDVFIEGILECEARVQNTPGLRYHEGMFLRPALALHTIRQDYQGSSSTAAPKRLKYSFLELVELFFYTQSSEARDKIFALLNLAHDMEDEAFCPDYGSDDSVILSRCALHLVKSQHALDLIYHAGFDKGASFCRWIPDFMNSAKTDLYAPTISTWESAGTGGHAGFSAGAPLSLIATAEDLGGRGGRPVPVLSISGRFFDTIQNCRASGVNSTGTGILFCQVIHDFRKFISHLHNYHYLGESWEIELIIKCLTGDAARPQISSSSASSNSASTLSDLRPSTSDIWPPNLTKYVSEIDPRKDGYEYARQRQGYEKVHDLFWETVSAFLRIFPGTNICVTEKGYAGIVPSSAVRGDKIFVPHSSKVPLILRKSEIQGLKPYHYQLVGEAYIQGIMYYDQSPLREMSGQKDEQICLI